MTRVPFQLSLVLFIAAVTVSAGPNDWGRRANSICLEQTPKLMRIHHVPGASIALVENQRIVWADAFGVANAESKAAVTTNTLFEAASMSKPLFAYAVLKLVEAEKLNLDRPLSEYLIKPYLADEPRHRQITARMVLNHTSGFPNWRKGGWRSGNPLSLKFEPGAGFGYSGEGFLYLQRVAEHLTGEPLDRLMRQRLLRPLGMSTSSYKWESANSTRIAAGHHQNGSLKTAVRRYDHPNAAYTLFTTPSEYARFLIEMMKPDRSADHSLSAEMLSAMIQPDTHDQTRQRHFGLGWSVLKRPHGNLVAHGGANGSGFRCFSRFDPKRRTGIVIMTNGIGGASLHQDLLKLIDATD